MPRASRFTGKRTPRAIVDPGSVASNSKIEIARADPGDMKGIVTLVRQLGGSFIEDEAERKSLQDNAVDLQEAEERGADRMRLARSGILLVAKYDGEIIGFCSVAHMPSKASSMDITRFVVRPDFTMGAVDARGPLLDAVKEAADGLGSAMIAIDVKTADVQASSFLTAKGFRLKSDQMADAPEKTYIVAREKYIEGSVSGRERTV